MSGVAINVFYRADLNDLTEVHHHDPVTDIANDIQIVTDEYIGQVLLGLDQIEQIQNLRFDRFVERRDGFIQYQETGA